MSSDIAIRVEGLSKSYRVRGPETRSSYRTLQEEIVGFPRRVASNLRRSDSESDRFWALRDVSLDVRQGEVLGIIGRNGAGKSTLLKILSRITDPTEGRAELYGRLGTLLEVGTGFHPELTGRENIFLSGAVLGMRKREIAARFDETVAFAEVERFVDTPVKHFSSGMYMRLAFSVAAHLNPEILIVDEVLAVGDAEFQKKCLGKMGEVARNGRTVLFVSHNLAAVNALCSRAALLDGGELVVDGLVPDVCNQYRRITSYSPSPGTVYVRPERFAHLPFRIERVDTLDARGAPMDAVHTWDDVTFRFHYHVELPIRDLGVELFVKSLDGTPLIRASTAPDNNLFFSAEPGEHVAACTFSRLPLSAGRYIVGVALARPNVEFLYLDEDGGAIDVSEADVFHAGRAPSADRALLVPDHEWQVPGAVCRR